MIHKKNCQSLKFAGSVPILKMFSLWLTLKWSISVLFPTQQLPNFTSSRNPCSGLLLLSFFWYHFFLIFRLLNNNKRRLEKRTPVTSVLFQLFPVNQACLLVPSCSLLIPKYYTQLQTYTDQLLPFAGFFYPQYIFMS